MTPNILICRSEDELAARFSSDFIAHIDGKKAQTLRQFYEEMADLLEIPDFGYTLDTLNDALNDLQWLEEERIIFYFTDTDALVSKERDPKKLGNVMSVLDAVAEDWKWTEDEINHPKEIVLVFEDSSRIRQLVDKESIRYAMLSEMK